MILDNRVIQQVEAGEGVRRRKGQGDGKRWEGMEEEVGGVQDRELGQVGTGESKSPNQTVEEGDGRMRGKVGEETQVGIQMWGHGGAGMRAHPGGPGGLEAQGEEGVEEGEWVESETWGPKPIKVGVEGMAEETKRTRCQTASRAPSKAHRHNCNSNNHSPAISIHSSSKRWTKGLCKGAGGGNPSPKPRIRTKAQAGPRGPFPAAQEEVEVDLNRVAGRNPRRSP